MAYLTIDLEISVISVDYFLYYCVDLRYKAEI